MQEATTRPADPRRSGRRSIGGSGPGMTATLEWLRKAVGSDDAAVQVLLPDATGRLYVLDGIGDPVAGGRRRSGRRRQVLRTGRSTSIALASAPGRSLQIHALTADDDTIGLVEIVGPAAELAARREIIDAVVGQSAIVVRSMLETRESDSALRTTADELRVAAELLRAETPVSAVKSAIRHCFERLRAPVAGLLPDRSGTGWYVAAAHGIGPAKRTELHRSVDEVSVSTRPDRLGTQLAERFASVVGRASRAVEAGDAVLLVAEGFGERDGSIDTVASLLGEALERLGSVGWAMLRNENLDLAIAWTAHELKSPLVAALAAIDRVAVAGRDPGDRELLRRTGDELHRLADLVDALLRWSAGSGPLRLRRTDLGRIVSDAVASCRLGSADRILIVNAPQGIVVRADERELGAAIANVVRNALEYSPSSSPVTVDLDVRGDVARVRVHDHGRGVPASERHVIFDPFTRGRAAEGRWGGKGLGLFIARRVAEAHGGTIGLLPVRTGAEFCIELPLADPEPAALARRRRSLSAS